MKKLMAICAATVMLAAVASSCNKVCECTATSNGVSVTTEVNLKDSGVKNCADMNSDVYGVKTVCKKK